MKRIISMIVSLALCACMLCWAYVPASAADGDEIRSPKKIISVVYDDSTSMYGDRWVYANYAMQALIAQLNEQDVLYITYMSRPDSSVRVDLSNLDKAVAEIRHWMHANDTPIKSMDTARKTLEEIDESDPSAQFWCVVMTDGGFNDLQGTIQEKLNSFKGITMSNGSAMNVAYLAMGPGAVKAFPDKNKGLYTYDADAPAKISGTIAEIANLISGRITADNVKQIDDVTFSFRSELPLYSISILSQNSDATVVSASAETALHIDRNISLKAFEPYQNCETVLTGNAAVINLEDTSGTKGVIQPDTYTITFSKPVNKDNLLIQYEPAIGMKLEITCNGEPVDDTADLKTNDKVSVRMIPVNPGTGEVIKDSSLPKGLSWTIEYIVDGTLRDDSKSEKLNNIQLLDGENLIRGTMRIPGFAPSVYEVRFELHTIVYHFGIEVDQPDPLVYYRRDTGGQTGSQLLTFRITNDGLPLSAQEQDEIGVRLKTVDVSVDSSNVNGLINLFSIFPAKCTLIRGDDGSYTMIPNPIIPFTAFLTHAGDYTVTVMVDADPGITATGTFNMVAQLSDWYDLIMVILILFIIGCLIYSLFIKYKFANQTIYYEVYQMTASGRGTHLIASTGTYQLKRYCLNTWWPFSRATTANICGLTFQAGPGGSVIITGKSMAKGVERYGPSTSNPTTSLRPIVAALRPTRKTVNGRETVVATDQSLSANRPIYFQTHSTDRNIWRIRISE